MKSIRSLGASLLFVLVGCSTAPDATFNITGTDATGKDLPAGATIEDCITSEVSGSDDAPDAYCFDGDGDTYLSASISDPFHTGCVCVIAGDPGEGWLEETSTATADFGDCDDTNEDIFDASLLVYPDLDGDFYGTGTGFMACGAEGYATAGGDCDDDDDNVNPGALEVCNGHDDNCDGDEDDASDKLTWYADTDNDTFGDPDVTMLACTAPDDYVANSTDCDDDNTAVYPGATEICNGLDDNCNTIIDTDAEVAPTWFEDTDGDGYGVSETSILACSLPSGYSALGGDCNDSNTAINPGATEACNGVNDDCDGEIDEGLDFDTWYADSDGDGFGNASASTSTCDGAPTGFIADDTDCNDSNTAINPGAMEACNGADDDCDALTDEGVCEPEPDADADGDPDTTDCDDGNSAINHSATEVCDSVDNDCDGGVDEGVVTVFYADSDSDGYGDADVMMLACTVSEGYVTNSTDCDDDDGDINPAATEVCNDTDDDCDDSVDEGLTCDDVDADGFTVEEGDCNDLDAAINPDAVEVSMNGVDDNCDGLANVSDVLEICVTPAPGLMFVSWQEWVRDWSVTPDGSLDPDWTFPGYAQGVGTLCTDFLVVNGHTLAINGPFDNDGDGIYGEESGAGDGTWLYQDVSNCDEVTIEGVLVSPLSFDWGWGYDGHVLVNIL